MNGSLGGSLFRDFLGARFIEEAAQLQGVAAKGHYEEEGPGWRHERHSAALVSREKIRSLASLGAGSEDLACQGREHRKGPHGWKSLWVADAGPLHGWDGRSSLGGQTALASLGHAEACAGTGVGTRVSTTGATEVTFSQAQEAAECTEVGVAS